MERKTIDDAPLSEKTLDDMIHDNYAEDEYRTDSTKGFSLFNFKTKSEPVVQWKVKEFSSWFKNPSGVAVADSKPIIPYMNHKVVPNAPEKIDHNMFGNVVIKNQKDIPVDRMNRELPEKFAYGLDRKGMGDIAYETLDIEYGDENGLSRATANFYEDIYLKQTHGIDTNAIKTAEPKIRKGLDNAIKTMTTKAGTAEADAAERVAAKASRRLDENKILVEEIPQFLEKADTKISNETSQTLFNDLMKQDNKPLSVPEINRINNILKKLNAKTIPYNTKAHNAAEKMNQAYLKDFEKNKSDQFHAQNKTKRQQEERKKKQALIKQAQDKAIANATAKVQSKAKTTTQSALKAKQSPIISPDSETRRKRSQSIDLADVRASPVARPWNDPDWLSSNLGTTGTPIHGSEESKHDPPALPPPTNLDMGGGGPRPKTRSQVPKDVSPASTKGEGKEEEAVDEGSEKGSARKTKRQEKKEAIQKEKDEIFMPINNYVVDILGKSGIKSIEDLKDNREPIPEELRDELARTYKVFKANATLGTIYNWYKGFNPKTMTLEPIGEA
jgi:hypothetical protein